MVPPDGWDPATDTTSILESAIDRVVAESHPNGMVVTVREGSAARVLLEASRGALDIAIHWGLLTKLRTRIEFNPAIVVIAVLLDVVVLAAFVWVRASTDMLSLYVAGAGILLIVVGERVLMRSHTRPDGTMDM